MSIKEEASSLMKKYIALMMAALFLLSGCQATPEQGIVTSKNDGAFDEIVSRKICNCRDHLQVQMEV